MRKTILGLFLLLGVLAGCRQIEQIDEPSQVALAEAFVRYEITDAERRGADHYLCPALAADPEVLSNIYPLEASISTTTEDTWPEVEKVDCYSLTGDPDRVLCDFSTIEIINDRRILDSRETWRMVFSFEAGKICAVEYYQSTNQD